MKIKWGALVVDGRGKIGGQVASKNKSGAYMKNKVTPSNPQTSAQQSQRQLLAAFAQAWRNLTEAERTSWISAAPDFPSTNQFGDTYEITGNMLFNKLNLNLSKIGQASINTAPTPTGVGEGGISALTVSAGSVEFDLSIACPVGQSILVRATTGFGAGVSNFKNKLRNLEVIAGDGSTVSHNVFASYSAKYGAPVVGQKIGIEVVFVNDTTGESGVPTKFSAIVA